MLGLTRNKAHIAHDADAVAQVGQGLDVRCAQQGLARSRLDNACDHEEIGMAVWWSNCFRAAPRRWALGHYLRSVVASPHLFSRVAVLNLCIRA